MIYLWGLLICVSVCVSVSASAYEIMIKQVWDTFLHSPRIWAQLVASWKRVFLEVFFFWGRGGFIGGIIGGITNKVRQIVSLSVGLHANTCEFSRFFQGDDVAELNKSCEKWKTQNSLRSACHLSALPNPRLSPPFSPYFPVCVSLLRERFMFTICRWFVRVFVWMCLVIFTLLP